MGPGAQTYVLKLVKPAYSLLSHLSLALVFLLMLIFLKQKKKSLCSD